MKLKELENVVLRSVLVYMGTATHEIGRRDRTCSQVRTDTSDGPVCKRQSQALRTMKKVL